MSKNEWSQQSKKKVKEETFLLSELINKNGCCTWCMINKCKNFEEHGADFPLKMTDFILKPFYIKEISELIKKNDLGFNDTTLFFTTCIYGINNGRCKNCHEGRFKYIDFNGTNIRLCFPPLENKNKITIGIHDFDIKLILKGNHFDVSAFPIKYKDEVEEETFDEEEEIFVTEKIDSYDDLYPDMESPAPTTKNNAVKKMDYSSIILKTNLENKIEDPIIEEKSVIDEIADLKIEKSLYESLYEENKENLSKLEKLSINIFILEKKIKELEMTNLELKNQNAKEMHIIKHKHKYDEILHNLKNLNAISEQFVNANYSEYLLVD